MESKYFRRIYENYRFNSYRFNVQLKMANCVSKCLQGQKKMRKQKRKEKGRKENRSDTRAQLNGSK